MSTPIKLVRDNLKNGDLIIALWPSATRTPNDRLGGHYCNHDLSWLQSSPKHIILGIIRLGIFHCVED